MIYLLICLFSLLLLIRNQEVFNYRRKVINYVYCGSDWQKKVEIFDEVSYQEMFWKFWKSVESFFPKEWDI